MLNRDCSWKGIYDYIKYCTENDFNILDLIRVEYLDVDVSDGHIYVPFRNINSKFQDIFFVKDSSKYDGRHHPSPINEGTYITLEGIVNNIDNEETVWLCLFSAFFHMNRSSRARNLVHMRGTWVCDVGRSLSDACEKFDFDRWNNFHTEHLPVPYFVSFDDPDGKSILVEDLYSLINFFLMTVVSTFSCHTILVYNSLDPYGHKSLERIQNTLDSIFKKYV